MTPHEWMARAHELQASGQHGAAAQVLNLACVQCEQDARLHAMLGRALLQVEQPGFAIEPLRKALRLNPELGEARKDLAMALAQAGEPTTPWPHERNVETFTAVVVGVAALMIAWPAFMLASFLGAPLWTHGLLAATAGVTALMVWKFLVRSATVATPPGRVIYAGRRSLASYWRYALIPALLLIAMAALALLAPAATLLVLVLAIALKLVIAHTCIVIAPGARPLYLLIDHEMPAQRSIIVKQCVGLLLREDQIMAMRLERVELDQDMIDTLLGLWRLNIHVSRDGLLDPYVMRLETPDRLAKAGEWRNEVTRMIAQGRRFIGNPGGH